MQTHMAIQSRNVLEASATDFARLWLGLFECKKVLVSFGLFIDRSVRLFFLAVLAHGQIVHAVCTQVLLNINFVLDIWCDIGLKLANIGQEVEHLVVAFGNLFQIVLVLALNMTFKGT